MGLTVLLYVYVIVLKNATSNQGYFSISFTVPGDSISYMNVSSTTGMYIEFKAQYFK